MPLFPDLDALEVYVDTYIKANGNNEITGPQANNSLNGCIEFIRQSPLNYDKAQIASTSGAVVATSAIVVITEGQTPSSLSFSDNIYHQYVFINMSALPVPLANGLYYYNNTGGVENEIAAASAVVLYKAKNDLWVQGNTTGSGGGGAVQRQPKTYIVGSTPGGPTIETNTWSRPEFANAYIMLFVNRIQVDLIDAGDGSPFITKSLGSDTLTIDNYSGGWSQGDILSYILITP